ncbi:helix-turn-helix domain-containing protein [Rhizobium sp. CC1099]|uniref:helix-turn-helix transcriptional regulator n=1 Tax=Rhizobium sp. CC1099 TaxID=3039160 RepID=UPI0024B0B9C4|nr:helix-turn-helix domain-containing protein [Rhizobium sp. CC1099]WFU88970.1 helix-turn-helix domain-containing protein [Rhizobium sp. CC1099]
MKRNIRVKEAAHYIGLSKSTLDKLRHFGGGPRYYKLGRAVVYDTEDLDAWKAERARTETWNGANDNSRAARAA